MRPAPWPRGLAVLVALAALAACGGDDDDDVGGNTLDVEVNATEGGLVDIEGVECRRDADQLLASGIARNGGDNPHYVNISVRFVDGDDVRVELASDSVSDLVTGESARWEATIYASAADSVVRCEVSATAT
jgi:hypothetical protein